MVLTVPAAAASASSVSTPAAPSSPAPAGVDVPPWGDSLRPRRHRPGSSRDSYIEVQYASRAVLGTLRQLRRAGTITERQLDVGLWLVEIVLTWSRWWDAVDFKPLAAEYRIDPHTLRGDVRALEASGVLRRWRAPGRGYLTIIEFPVPEAGRVAAAKARNYESATTAPVTAPAAEPAAPSVPAAPKIRASLPPSDSVEYRAGRDLFIGICDVMRLPKDVVSNSVRRLFIVLAGNGWTVPDLKELLLRDVWPKELTGDGVGLMKYRLETYAAGRRPPRLEREEVEQVRAERQRQQQQQSELATQLLAEREERHRREHYLPLRQELDGLPDAQWNALVRPAAHRLGRPQRGDSTAETFALRALAVRTGYPQWQAPREWTDRDFDQQAALTVAVEGLVAAGPAGPHLEPGCLPG